MLGMNSHGLCVVVNTLFVPDNKWDGVPSFSPRRPSLPEAVAYIRTVPLAIPLNFVLCQPGHGICNLEASHVQLEAIATAEAPGAVYAHCNHCQSASFIQREELPVPEISTKQRQQVLLDCISKAQACGAPMDLLWLQNVFLKPPINNSFVIATVCMEPSQGRMHVRFGTPTVARSKKRKRAKWKETSDAHAGIPEEAGLHGGILDWRQMETAKSLLPAYAVHAIAMHAAALARPSPVFLPERQRRVARAPVWLPASRGGRRSLRIAAGPGQLA